MEEEYSDERLEEICNKVYDWGVEFSKSKHYEELTQEQKKESEFVVMSFTEYMYSYYELSPEKWDEDGLEECCLYTLPEKITADESYYKSIAPVLSAFFAFIGEKKLLKNASLLTKRVKKIDKQIIKNARDPRNWGMAKSFVMSAKREGVNIFDEKEMQGYLLKKQMEALTNILPRETKGGGKMKGRERNLPCPCGSGKKYKKCCGR